MRAFEDAIHRSGNAEDPRAALELACGLYQGEFCEGHYYSWAPPVIERYQGLFARAAKRLALLLGASGRIEEALVLLDRAIACDPYDEEVYRQAILLEGRRGRHDLVSRRYRRLRRVLLQDLDTQPSMETVEVLQRLSMRPHHGRK
ncbi:MAG: bacterial transcriptional activator domain-containing protein [Actinomycetota bacterium]